MPCLTKHANKVPWWFYDIWVPMLFLPPKKLGFMAQIRPIFWAYIGLSGPYDALLVGGCDARAALSIERLPTLHHVITFCINISSDFFYSS